MHDPENLENDEDGDEEEEVFDDDSYLRRRSFLERNDWIPWMVGAIIVGGTAGFLDDYIHWPW